jgi:hypothetical protein
MLGGWDGWKERTACFLVLWGSATLFLLHYYSWPFSEISPVLFSKAHLKYLLKKDLGQVEMKNQSELLFNVTIHQLGQMPSTFCLYHW